MCLPESLLHLQTQLALLPSFSSLLAVSAMPRGRGAVLRCGAYPAIRSEDRISREHIGEESKLTAFNHESAMTISGETTTATGGKA